MPTPITLTTDFGQRDAYVGAMKGVLLSLAPGAPLIDISHEVAPQDVMEAAFLLREAYPYFPEGTVHLAVVDPGVGTERRAIAIRAGGHFFVGPDNGLFSLVLSGSDPEGIVVLDRPKVWRAPDASATFHGRDVFAPVAARLATGARLKDVGTPTDTLHPLRWAMPVADDEGIRGWIVHVDRYGNCVTNISEADVQRWQKGRGLKAYAGSDVLEGLHHTYADVPPGDGLLLVGSSGLLEVAVNRGNAAELLGIRKGASITLVFSPSR